MNEQQLAQLLIQKGWFGAEEFTGNNLAEILIRRGIISKEETESGLSLHQILTKRGLI